MSEGRPFGIERVMGGKQVPITHAKRSALLYFCDEILSFPQKVSLRLELKNIILNGGERELSP